MVIQRDMKDPRIGMVTVNDVDVSRDLSFAKVYVTFFDENPEQIQEKLAALTKASGYIRSLVAGRMKLRVMPELKFEYDSSLVEGMRMSTLVTEVVIKDQEKAKSSDRDDEETA